MSNVLITQGTQTSIKTDTVSGNDYQVIKLDYGASGASVPFTGTLPEITNIVGGTVTSGTVVGVGTLSNVGSINSITNIVYGTVQIDPTPKNITPLVFGTLGTAGGSLFGTLSAASGAGTKQYVTGVSVIGQSGTADVRILAGSVIQGTGVLGAGNVVPGGGYISDFTTPFATGTNSELLYHFVGAGTAFIIIKYWKGL